MIKIIFKKQLLLLICCIIIVGCVTSCKKDTTGISGKVELLSFGPSGAQHGEQITFIGNNLDKVTAIKLVGDSVPTSAFVEQTSERIVIVISSKVEKGLVILKTPDGDLISKTILDFTVPVTITSITQGARPGDNITISGDYVNWITEVVFSKDVSVKTFVSKSVNALVVKVPINARTGYLTINTSGSKPLTISSVNELVVTLPSITAFSPSPIERGGNLTITGANLDLVHGVLFKGLATADTTFISRSATQIVVKVPAGVNRGKISLVAYSGVAVESGTSLLFVGDLPDLAPLAYAFYEDALQGSWQNWGWNTTVDFANTDNVRDGLTAMKVQYTGQWSALKFANGSVSTTGYTELAFSIFGTAGTDGMVIHVQPSGGSNLTITIQEGKWVEFKMPLSTFGSPATITDCMFQNEGWTGTIYMDHVGLR